MEKKRKFLIATGDPALRDSIGEVIKAKIPQAVIVGATDANEAMFKIQNDLPNVVYVDEALAKGPGTKIVEWIVREKKDAHVAAILISPIPEKEQFVDEIVTGKVQILEGALDPEKVVETLARAARYIMSGEKIPFNTRKLATKELLIREGEKATSVYILKKGRLRAFLERETGEEVLGDIESGEFVGEMAYINGEPRSAHVAALEDCELIEIPITHLDHMLFNKPAWAKALMKTLSKRVKTANQIKRTT